MEGCETDAQLTPKSIHFEINVCGHFFGHKVVMAVVVAVSVKMAVVHAIILGVVSSVPRCGHECFYFFTSMFVMFAQKLYGFLVIYVTCVLRISFMFCTLLQPDTVRNNPWVLLLWPPLWPQGALSRLSHLCGSKQRRHQQQQH